METNKKLEIISKSLKTAKKFKVFNPRNNF